MRANATIALLGQPNAGKSTLFNALTGLRQHVGNWPGKTVEKKEGNFSHKGVNYMVADLPGSYSLSANSDEEVITRDYIASGDADIVCILADSSQLQRSMFMLADYAGIDVPCILLLNMADVAKQQGKSIDAKAIENKLGIPVIPFSATDKKSYDVFYNALDKAVASKNKLNIEALENKYESIEGFQQICGLIPNDAITGYSSTWLAVKAIEGDKVVMAKLSEVLDDSVMAQIESIAKETKGAVATGGCKFAWIDDVLDNAVSKKSKNIKLGKLDKIYLSRVWGKPAVVLTVILGLLASFIPAIPPMIIGSVVLMLKAPIASGLAAIGAPHILTLIINDVVIQSLSYIIKMLVGRLCYI